MKKSKKGGSKKNANTQNKKKSVGTASSKTPVRPTSPDEIFVKLKPKAGISPVKYVPVLYIVGIILIIFLVLFLPGIRKNGSLVSFDSYTDGAAVYVDNTLVGSTPCKAFVKKGDHSLRFVKTGFETLTVEKSIKGRIFGSWFVPRKESVTPRLNPELKTDIVTIKFGNFYRWLSAGGYNRTTRKPLPPIITALSEDIYRTEFSDNGINSDKSDKPNYNEGERAKLFNSVWKETLPHVNSLMALKDMVKGEMIASAGGSVMTSSSLLNSLCTYAEIAEEGPYVVEWFDSLAATENQTPSERFPVAMKPIEKEETIPAVSEPRSYPVITRGFTRFVEIPGGEYTRGSKTKNENYEAPAPQNNVKVLPFAIMENEVSVAFFNEFIEENPQWAAANRVKLMEKGLVDENYLNNRFDSEELKSGSYPVRNVSWFAAVEFCRWFTEKYLTNTNLIARLPYEAEWEYAALLNQVGEKPYISDIGEKRPGAIGLNSMIGSVWEWTLNDFGEFDYFFPQSDYSFLSNYFDNKADVSERVVRGGCWVAETAGKDPHTRGAQPPQWSTPFTGFRMVLEEQPRPMVESSK